MTIIQIDKTDSSNRYARDYIRRKELSEPLLFVAEEQTAGKGQGTNSWHSQKGKNITCSFVFKPKISAENQFMLSQAISLGIIDFLEQFSSNFAVKWPNDIYHNNKKIAGILIENSLSGNNIKHCIAGVGININQKVFPKELPNPSSLSHITAKDFQLKEILPKLYESIEKRISGLLNNTKQEIENQYLNKLYRYKQRARFKDKDGVFNGVIIGIDPFGRLLIKDTDSGKQKKYDFKEIVFL